MKKLFEGKSRKAIAIVSIAAILVTGGSAFAAYKYMEYKHTEQINIELAKKAEEERKAKKLEEKMKLKELRESNGIDGIAAFNAEKYAAVIADDEKSLLVDYEKNMMEAQDVEEFEKLKAKFDGLVAQLDVRLDEWNAEQQRIKEEEERKAIEAEEQKQAQQQTQKQNSGVQYPSGGGVLTPSGGVNWFNGHKETYYNLDMSGVIANAHAMGLQGDYWIRDDGVKMFGGYVIVAAQLSKGTIVETSLGTGIVLDYCPAGTYDIAVSW